MTLSQVKVAEQPTGHSTPPGGDIRLKPVVLRLEQHLASTLGQRKTVNHQNPGNQGCNRPGRFKINPEAIAGRLLDSARDLVNSQRNA
jgi:hypothetical protein